MPQFFLIRLKLVGFFFQFVPLLLVLDDHLSDPLLLSLIFLLLFPDLLDPPSSHLIVIDLKDLFFVPLKYLLSEKCHAVLFDLLKSAKCSLLLDLSHAYFLLVKEFLVCEALLNIPKELSQSRAEVL